jgi:cytosine permease
MTHESVAQRIEDHALERVPDEARQGWLSLTWSTAGIVVSLVQLFFGALVCFVAGIKIALIAGIVVMLFGALLGWACGHIAFHSGLSSTVLSRYFGFGKQGSVIASLIFAFMIIGFLALENALLYRGFVFYFQLTDSVANKIAIYGAMTLVWVLLTSYGFKLVAKVSSVALILSLLVLAYVLAIAARAGSHSLVELLTFGSQFPPGALQRMGIVSEQDKFIFAVNVLIGSAGALALFDADLGRYARRSVDIGIAALLGNFAMDVLMLSVGGIIMYAGGPALVQFYMRTQGLTLEAASHAALQSPDSITATFVVLGGALGAALLVLAQGKTQVLNTYSASLSLSNLFDALHCRPGRLTFVILGNVIGLLLIYGNLLDLINSWVTMLGVLTTAFAGIIVADFFIVRRRVDPDLFAASAAREPVNWAGMTTLVMAVIASHYLLPAILPVEGISTLALCLIIYPPLRLWQCKVPLRRRGALRQVRPVEPGAPGEAGSTAVTD